jgi:hypothetical protein
MQRPREGAKSAKFLCVGRLWANRSAVLINRRCRRYPARRVADDLSRFARQGLSKRIHVRCSKGVSPETHTLPPKDGSSP